MCPVRFQFERCFDFIEEAAPFLVRVAKTGHRDSVKGYEVVIDFAGSTN